MVHRLFTTISKNFVSPEEVAAYRSTIPRIIHVGYKKDGKYYIAKIDEIDDMAIKGALVTQGETEDELITNINQLVYMYIHMPEKIRPYYGNSFIVHAGNLKHTGELELART